MKLVFPNFDHAALKLFYFVSLVLFRLSLDFTYLFVIAPVYSFMGFGVEFDVGTYLLSWAGFLIFYPFLPVVLERLSDVILLLAYLTFLTPLSSFYGMTDVSAFPFFVSTLSFFTFLVLTRKPVLNVVPQVVYLREGRSIVKLVSLLLLAFLVSWYFASGAVRYINFDFSKVYEFRELSAEVANVGFLAYLNSWIYQVVSIFLLAVCLWERKYFFVACLFLVQIFFFGVTGHKSLLFYPFLVLGVWFYFKRTSSALWLPTLLLGLVFTATATYFLIDNIWPVSLFVRRALFIPASLTYDYFSFFSVNDFVFWGNSVLSSVVEYPYSKNIAPMIGEYNELGGNANNGFVSNGYAHAGLVGVFIYTVIFSAFVLLLEKFTEYFPLWFSVAITVIPIRSAIISSDLLTVILTHGLLLTLIFVLLFRFGKPSRQR
ncbi:hypothetical protein FWJ25_04765 [Marinobacter salinexigens]|uniref:Uncharacterized protein n=1 Tax=Marinobacter salinexigens TaxID=2919747 RepID=A0A5B0VJA0_9GAMM|nr:hypothetical protein [Marinobacter salinexigens]KAA1174706.1 hypothetical protein FWJ25_04765 [Marinobacter salinexigens]